MDKTWRTEDESRRKAGDCVRAMLDILTDLNHNLATATPEKIDQAARMVRSWTQTLGDITYEIKQAEVSRQMDTTAKAFDNVFDRIFPNGGKLL
jgi:hypothetical protein